MARFKIGDRVRVTRTEGNDRKWGITCGFTGVISGNYGQGWLVKLDNFTIPADARAIGPVEEDSWRFFPDQLEPLASSLDTAIAEYQAACERFERAQADVADAKIAIQRALES